MNSMFQVTNPLGDFRLDREILNSILDSNGINCEMISQSNENDSKWLVQLNEDQTEILERNDYLLRGLRNDLEYCLHFCPLPGAPPSLPERSQQKVSNDQLPSSKDTGDQSSAGNLELPTQMKHSTPVTNIDDEEKTLLVRNVPEDFDLEFLKIFLENEKLSGGGKIRNLEKVENSTDIEVMFESFDVIDQVLKKSPLKFNDMSFPIIKKPKVNQVKEKLEELEEKTIEVHRIPVDMDLGIVRLYFENYKKSGGGKIAKDLVRNQITGTVLITYASSEDAIRVVKQGEHNVYGQKFSVNMYQGSKGKQFFLSEVKSNLSEEIIIDFLESKAEICVKNVIKMEAENTWLVYCDDIVDFSQVQQLCKAHTLNFISDSYPKVFPVPVSDTILVRTLLCGLEDMIKLYFEGCTCDVKFFRKLSDDQFLVTFNDPSVVPVMCQKSHKILDNELQVMPYYKDQQSGANYEEYLLDSSFQLEFMKKYQSTMEVMLGPHVKPIWSKSNGQVLKIEFSRCSNREDGLKTLKDLLQNIHEETIKLSPEMFERAKQLIEKETLNAIVFLDSTKQTLQIVAFGRDNLFQLKESLGSSRFLTSNKSQTIPMDSYKITLLFAEKFPQKMQEKYPGILFERKKNKIIITGCASNFSLVENEMYKLLNSIQCIPVMLPKHASFLLERKPVNNYLMEKLKKKKCTVSWEIKEKDSIIVYSLQVNQLSIASDVFKSSIKTLDFGLGDPIKDVMKQKKWKVFWQRMQTDYANLFYLDEVTLTGVTIDSQEERIKFKFNDFLERNVIQENLVPLDKTQVDYLREKKTKDFDDFCQKFGTENPVTMTIRPDNKLCIKASSKNMVKALAFIDETIKGFKELGNMMEYFGITNDKRKKKSTNGKNLLKIFQRKYGSKMIDIYQGDMTELPVGAIVNAANKEMLHGGGVAKAIINKGGFKIQTESKAILASLNSKFISVGEAIITSGGDLPCQNIIHAVGPIWTGGNNKEKDHLSNAVKRSLEIADQQAIVSIAFPAISAGSYRYPLEKVVNVMTSTVKEYLDKNPTTSLKNISFVDTRSEVISEFRHQIEQVFFPETSENKRTQPKPTSKPQQVDTPKAVTKSLIIMKDELQKKKVDIIVSSISSDLDFSKGKLSHAILQSAGKEMQNECKKFTDLSAFQVMITKGYKLHCQNVFHISLPFCKEDADVIIPIYMKQCLGVADNYKASSIAFPSLGTGQLDYPPAVVAKLMLKAAYQHLNEASTSLKEVFIVIYPKDTHIFKAFQHELDGWAKNPGINIDVESNKLTIEMSLKESVNTIQGNPSKSAKTSSKITETPNQSVLQLSAQGVPTQTITSPDFLLGAVQIFLINGDLLDEQTDAIVNCTDAKFSLRGAISRCLCRKSGNTFSQDCQSKKRTSAMGKEHFAITAAHHLKCQLILHLDVVSELSEPKKILKTCFHAAEKFMLSSLSIPQLAANGKNVPLDEMADAMVEVIPKLKNKFLKRINVVVYQSKMLATLKSDILNAQKGNLVHSKMTRSDVLKVAPLQNTDAEYKKVEKEFLSTIGRKVTIKSIEKIKNKPLKMQYEAQLVKMKALNPPKTKNEHTLWHGTKKETVGKISNDGFDRGYCGINGTWHGQGVYFALQSEYSDKDIYSPRDANGNKHMFMCLVGTGVYVQGTSDMRVLPVRPNSTLKYDSATNNPANPTVFIIFNDVQAYPAYHITYC